MPTLYPTPLPDAVRRDPRRGAEVRVYDALAKQLGDGWEVYHSVAWQGAGKDGHATDGEADFVLAHPAHGLIVLEVKGGEIIHDAPTGKWASRDAQGNIHNIKDPFAQARRSKYALVDKLRELPALKNRKINCAYGVVFPSAVKDKWALRPDAPAAIIIDQADMADLPKAVGRIHAHYRGEQVPSPLDAAGMDAVRRLLARSFELQPLLSLTMADESAQMLRLTEAQFNVLDQLGRWRRAAIHGGAGTGKTLLALEKARRLAAAGFRTLLTCYNLPLEAHLRASAGGMPGLTIRGFHPFCYDAGVNHGLELPPMDRSARSQAYWDEELPEALMQAQERGMEPFDAIVMDEGQDFDDTWWIAIQQCLADPDGGILYVFLDANQQLYGRATTYVDALPPFDLNLNLRNTQAIQALAAGFYDGASLQAFGPAGRPPEIISLKPQQSIATELEKHLVRLVHQEKIAREDIAILTGRRPDRIGLPTNGKLGGIPIAEAEQARPGHTVLDTIHRFKGMDSAVVILTGLEGIYEPTARHLLYVGITRARSHLIVLERAEVLERWGLSSE